MKIFPSKLKSLATRVCLGLMLMLLMPTDLLAATSSTPDLYPFTNLDNASRFNRLTHEIRCVVCQNQTIADSDAPLAQDLRDKVYHMIQSGQSDPVIADYLVTRYGHFILFKPPFSLETWVLWLMPPLGLCVILGYRWRQSKKTVGAD